MSRKKMSVTIPDGLELVAVSDLVPYDRNARTHSEKQVEQIAASMREFGFTNPVLIDDELGIVAGHGRLMAAKSLGLKNVPVVRLSHLTPTQRRAYVIADNQLAMNAGWDTELLPLEVGELFTEGFDVELLGFDSDEESESDDDPWGGTTDPSLGSLSYKVVVTLADEDAQRRLAERLIKEGHECQILIL